MKRKITIIGAGSAIFSVNLVKDICITQNLCDSTICFMDNDRERLDTIFELCRRYSMEVGISLNLEKTTDRREALLNADFVINTALASGHDHLREGWNIAYKHGYRFGGSLHIVHDEAFWINYYQLNLMDSIVKDMMEICPDAWLILVANPVLTGVTYLKRKYNNLKIVGMCHGYAGIYELAEELGLEKEYITYEIPGVNHFVWLRSFYYKGCDAFPLIDRWIEEKSKEFWKTCSKSSGLGPKAIDLYKKFGVYPIGDTCTTGGGAWGYWYHTDAALEASYLEDPYSWYADYFEHSRKQVAEIKHLADNPSLKVTDVFKPQLSNEPMIPLIESIACDIPRTIIVNIMNTGGYVPGVPTDFEVEIPALVSKRGIQGIQTNELPKTLLSYILKDRVAPVETELDAYEKGSYNLLLALILMDPWTRSEKQAKAFLDEILSLPYHDKMREHYK